MREKYWDMIVAQQLCNCCARFKRHGWIPHETHSMSLVSYTTVVQETFLKNISKRKKKNVKFTTPIQQLHNNSSHESGSYTLGLTLMWGAIVQLL
jgi:adenine-specific DNA methylase